MSKILNGDPSPEADVEGNIKEADLEGNITEADVEGNIKEADLEGNIKEADVESNIIEADVESNIIEADVEGKIKEADVESNIIEADVEGNTKEADVESNIEEADVEGNIIEADEVDNITEAPAIVAAVGVPDKTTSQSSGGKESDKKKTRCNSWLHLASYGLVHGLEKGCGRWGRTVAAHPVGVTMICVAAVALASVGLLYIKAELRPYKLWIPQDSEFIKVTNWQTENFPREFRRHVILWEAKDGNVLTAAAIQEMWQVHQEVNELITMSDDEPVTWADVCVKVPSILDPATPGDYSYDAYSYDEVDYGSNEDYSFVFPTLSPDYYDYDSSEWNTVGLELWSNDSLTFDSDQLPTEFPTTNAPMSETIKMIYDAVPSEIVEGVRADSSISMSRDDYCSAISVLLKTCFENSILEVFGYDDELIMSLTDEKVVDAINDAYVSQIYGFPTEFDKFLGGIKRDENGTIVSAAVAIHIWTTQINKDALLYDSNVTLDPGNGEIVDNKGFAWEEAFVEHVLTTNLEVLIPHVNAAHSFGAVSGSLIHNNVKYVAAGWGLLVLYVLMTLGRIGPAIVGLVCIGMSVLASYGFCAAIGLPYGPINAILPVLLVGLGVDDMFVITASWEAQPRLSSKERAFKAMSNAGVAITVTSVTDVVAFMVGATTQVPALRWFCIYAAVGVTFVYILQATMFVAGLVIDQWLKDKKKMSFTINKRENDGDKIKATYLNQAMNKFAKALLNSTARICVLVLASLILVWGFWGTASLQQKFDPVWFLPQSSYLFKWFGAMDTHFPSAGERGSIFFSNVSLPEELPGLRQLYASLKKAPHVSNVDAWFSVFDIFFIEHPSYQGKNLTADLFYDALGLFVHSSSGAIFRNHFVFDTNISCEGSSTHFSAFKIDFQYARQTERSEQQAAMLEVRDVVAAANISGYHAAWAHVYSEWETDATLTGELWRNLSVVTAVVAAMTVVLLASTRAAMLVILCVLATLLDVAALMHSWGLTVDTITCIALILAIGLCVDYAAHVAHAFLSAKGDKKVRARTAVAEVGPAVLHGGVSTLLAFVMLAFSDSYLFLSFCKIFTGVSAFGLFHGLVILPILLSFVGPESYSQGHDKKEDIQIVYVVELPTDSDSLASTSSSIAKRNASTFTILSCESDIKEA